VGRALCRGHDAELVGVDLCFNFPAPIVCFLIAPPLIVWAA
jgi:hypothetical protein